MKICWGKLEGLRLNSNGTFVKGHNSYVEKERCIECGNSYLTLKHRQSEFCDRSCSLKRRVYSKETKQKMVEAWKTREPVSEETKRKQSKARKGLLVGERNGMYGKTFSAENKSNLSTRMKNNKYALGMKHSEETKRALSVMNMGKLNGNWKGGISCAPYCFEWANKEFKLFIKERDGNMCLNPYCSTTNPCNLSIHHIDYDKKNCDPDNLITICNSCNSLANKDRHWHTSWYQAIIYRRS